MLSFTNTLQELDLNDGHFQQCYCLSVPHFDHLLSCIGLKMKDKIKMDLFIPVSIQIWKNIMKFRKSTNLNFKLLLHVCFVLPHWAGFLIGWCKVNILLFPPFSLENFHHSSILFMWVTLFDTLPKTCLCLGITQLWQLKSRLRTSPHFFTLTSHWNWMPPQIAFRAEAEEVFAAESCPTFCFKSLF